MNIAWTGRTSAQINGRSITLLSWVCSRTAMCGADGVSRAGRFARHHVFAHRRVPAFRAPHDFSQFSRLTTSVRTFECMIENRVSPRFRLRQRPHIRELILTSDSESSVHPQIFVGSASEDPVQPAGKPDPAMGSTITIAAAVIS